MSYDTPILQNRQCILLYRIHTPVFMCKIHVSAISMEFPSISMACLGIIAHEIVVIIIEAIF